MPALEHDSGSTPFVFNSSESPSTVDILKKQPQGRIADRWDASDYYPIAKSSSALFLCPLYIFMNNNIIFDFF